MPQPLQIVGPAYKTILSQNPQELVNWYLEDDPLGGKDKFILRPTPGLKSFGTMGTGVDQIRGMIEHRGVLYVVGDNTFYSVDSTGTETSRGTLNTTSGLVRLAASNDQIMCVDGTNGYIYTISTTGFTEITDADFIATPVDVTYQDGFFIVISNTDHKFYLSAINDGESWDALDFASATADPDYLVAVKSDHREIWLFGNKTTEIWFNSGNVDFTFERRPGVLMHKGCTAKNSVTRTDNSLYWLGKDETNNNVVIRAEGYTPRVISSRAVSQAIDGYSTVDDAVGFAYRQGNHEFYVLTFPTEQKTWVYDSSLDQWHERDSLINEEYKRWRPNCYAFAYGKHIVGDFNSGELYEIDNDTYTDAGNPIRRKRVSSHVNQNNYFISMYNFCLDMEPGVGIDSGQGSDPQVLLRVSKDGGHTWGNEMWRSMGAAGVYNRRIKWDALGAARNWTFEITVTDPVNAVILGAYADMEVGDA